MGWIPRSSSCSACSSRAPASTEEEEENTVRRRYQQYPEYGWNKSGRLYQSCNNFADVKHATYNWFSIFLKATVLILTAGCLKVCVFMRKQPTSIHWVNKMALTETHTIQCSLYWSTPLLFSNNWRQIIWIKYIHTKPRKKGSIFSSTVTTL